MLVCMQLQEAQCRLGMQKVREEQVEKWKKDLEEGRKIGERVV